MAADPQLVAQMQARIQKLTAQANELAQGPKRANTAFESQQERLAQNETELAATRAKLDEKTKALEEKASGSRPVYNGKQEEWEKFKHIFMSSTIHGDFPGLLDKFGKYDSRVDTEIELLRRCILSSCKTVRSLQ
jgi:predicted nuclease with TOPRIM domain